MILRKRLLVLAACCAVEFARAQDAGPDEALRLPIERWTNVRMDASSNGAELRGVAAFQWPDGPRGWYRVGLRQEHDGTVDLRRCYAIRFDVNLGRDDATCAIDLGLSIPSQPERENFPARTAARVSTRGAGWQTLTVPIEAFDYNRGQSYFLKFVKQLTLAATYADGAPGGVSIRDVRILRADGVALDAPIRSKPADLGGAATYPITVTNASEVERTFALTLRREGWEAFSSDVSPATLTLKPGESGQATLRVAVPDAMSVAPGASEFQRLVVTPMGRGDARPATLDFTTLRRLPAPYLIHDAAGWQAVRDKVAKYDWAKTSLEAIRRRADSWPVESVPAGWIKSSGGTPALFMTYGPEENLLNAAQAWAITRDRRYAEKVALFLRRMSDPATGYPKTLHATQGDIPQEGGFFANCADAYDLIQDAGVLSDADRAQVEASFRLYADWVIDWLGDGGISNWSVFNLAPAVKCALVLQDMQRVDTLMNGPCGLVDHLRYGLMDDGWWYEMSLSYNLGCAMEYTRVGVALAAFGNDFLNRRFPAATTDRVGLRPFEFKKFLGMAFGKYGPTKDNYVTVKKFWDGIVAYPDYRGVMFGMGDGHEQRVAGGQFELAYAVFGDPAYAAIVKQGGGRDLIHGVAELPAQTPTPYAVTARSDNAGVAVLRSQTAGREPREQIQAAIKYGTHGSYHGHFDRVSLLSLMRYGRSFWSPETSWFGYSSYMYKWWVQTSLPHNMVVVDGKMQEPRPGSVLLFHSGPMLQAIAVETTACWSNPPYMGGYDQVEKIRSGDAPFVPIPEAPPKIGELTGFTEPVRQRRLLVVTDDYVVLADDLRGEAGHVYDNLLHLRGVVRPASAAATHAAQFSDDPLGSGQFITNVVRQPIDAPARIESVLRIGGDAPATDSFEATPTTRNWETGGARSLSTPGELHIDAHVLWPAKAELAIGDYAESWPVNRKLRYAVAGDSKPLAAGVFGAWILGEGRVDVDVSGVKSLRLEVESKRSRGGKRTVFWTNPRVVTADGKSVPLAELGTRVSTSNVARPPAAGRDYEGGPIRVAGVPVEASLPGEPEKDDMPAVVTVDLAGLNAVRFVGGVGGDWPVGEEEQLRQTVAVRSVGKVARFLTLIEPFETKRTVVSATASGPDQLRVELADGRVQELTIRGLDGDAGDVQLSVRETKDGVEVRQVVASTKTTVK